MVNAPLPFIASIVETLVYAAALDLYRRTNARDYDRPVYLTSKGTIAMLRIVDWNARPTILASLAAPEVHS